MNTTAATPSTPRGRTQFLLLATLFFFPLLISYVLYFWFPGVRPSNTTNYGQLINPALPAPPLTFVDDKGAPLDQSVFTIRWSYAVLAGSDCDDHCLRSLVMTRQVRLAMNEKRSRVQRVLVLSDPAAVAPVLARLKPEHPDLRVIADVGEPGKQLSDFLQPAGAASYLLDPHGNWLLVYPSGGEIQTDFKGMQKDIKKLLRLSQIG
ncbi:hypothetical protein DFR24_4198 [Panacagrimonas perspica]|uniref:Cytochrome oxidase Cu insertion factor (SCO1/SenC/PrrC family) n=1 Tax=Panacagrimonas perspica TaxID=381431 RepID=A0A4S3K4A9_9GAMM|nr:hypothetical protein [Panacagrimonas perspica]TDU25753.1 hypothetical protein DFR24_4198 [Panacagrimonas perspica]THD02866.1 hypothetical protein B1810_13220 [Panacagrimonas perspica]